MDQAITIWQTDAEILRVLGASLKKRRLKADISQEKLALEVGVSERTIKNFESGKAINLETFIRILRFFGDIERINKLLEAKDFSPKEKYKNRNKKERQRASKSND